MMTRKDYVAVAEILSSFKDLIGDEFTYQDLVDEFGDLFSADNPNFKFDKFREACNEQNYNNRYTNNFISWSACMFKFNVARFKN